MEIINIIKENLKRWGTRWKIRKSEKIKKYYKESGRICLKIIMNQVEKATIRKMMKKFTLSD